MPQFSPILAAQMLFLPKFRSPNSVAIGSKNLFQITRRLDIRMEGYVYQPLREVVSTAVQTAAYRKYFSDRFFMGSMAFVYDSYFGPVSLSVNYFDKETESWSILFNIGYTLFNPTSR
jgi:NTE family protein